MEGLGWTYPTYVVIDLGNFFQEGIAGNGQMTGYMTVLTPGGDNGSEEHAARGTVGQIVDLGLIGRVNRPCPNGRAVGYANNAPPGFLGQEASLWNASNQLTFLGLLPGGYASAATSCNKQGLIGFYAGDPNLVIRAGYRDTQGVMHVVLPTWPYDTWGADLNNNHQILINADFADGHLHPLVCSLQGECIDLLPPDRERGVRPQTD
jgi:hypothetical protein